MTAILTVPEQMVPVSTPNELQLHVQTWQLDLGTKLANDCRARLSTSKLGSQPYATICPCNCGTWFQTSINSHHSP